MPFGSATPQPPSPSPLRSGARMANNNIHGSTISELAALRRNSSNTNRHDVGDAKDVDTDSDRTSRSLKTTVFDHDEDDDDDSFPSTHTNGSTSSIDNLQAIRTVAHLGDAPMFREEGHHLGRRNINKAVVFRGEPVRANNRSLALLSPPQSASYSASPQSQLQANTRLSNSASSFFSNRVSSNKKDDSKNRRQRSQRNRQRGGGEVGGPNDLFGSTGSQVWANESAPSDLVSPSPPASVGDVVDNRKQALLPSVKSDRTAATAASNVLLRRKGRGGAKQIGTEASTSRCSSQQTGDASSSSSSSSSSSTSSVSGSTSFSPVLRKAKSSSSMLGVKRVVVDDMLGFDTVALGGADGRRSVWSSTEVVQQQQNGGDNPAEYVKAKTSVDVAAGGANRALRLANGKAKQQKQKQKKKQQQQRAGIVVEKAQGVRSGLWAALRNFISATLTNTKSLMHRAQNTFKSSKELALGFIGEAVQERMQLWELQKHLREATTYARWREVAEKIDTIKLHDAWRLQNESKLYDWEQITNRLQHLRTLHRQNDVATIAYTLRAGLLRNIGGIDNPRLYEVSHVHTKKLIEDYHDTVVDLLIYLSRPESSSPAPHDASGEGMSIEERLHFFLETRHAFGRTALLLSGGGGMAIYHLGMVRTLMEHGLLPRVISGSSAGSLIGAVVACSTDDELKALMEPGALEFRALEIKDFPNSPSSLYRSVSRLVRMGVLFDSEVLKAFVVKYCGEVTFAQAFERTHRVLNVTVTSTRYATGKNGGEGSLLLNYLTAPNVLVWSAVVASCAIPGLFAPGELFALDKDGNVVRYNPSCKSSWCDGSVACDLPAKRLSELFNINQHVVSQTNPWVVPFVSSSGKSCSDYSWGVRGIWERTKYFIYSEARHRCTLGSELGIIPKSLNWLINFYFQTYTGDITLVPNIRPKDYLYVLQDPTNEHYEECMLRSQQSSWPKVHLIRARCQIEQTLDMCVERLRRKLRLQHDERDASLRDMYAKAQVAIPPSAAQQDKNESTRMPNRLANLRVNVTDGGKAAKRMLGISLINSLDDDQEIRDSDRYSPPSRSAVNFFGGRHNA